MNATQKTKQSRTVSEKGSRTAVPKWPTANAMDMKLALMVNWR